MLKNTCLNGLWEFSCATASLEAVPSVWDSVPIKVPSPFNVNSFSGGYPRNTAGEEYFVSGADFRLYPEYPLSWDAAQVGFYRRRFFVGEESRGHRLFLQFDAVAYQTVFYLNGRLIGAECEAFLPLEFEITDTVNYGEENELIVGCRTVMASEYKDADGRARTDFPEGSFWGNHIAGIWQDCRLVERNTSYIADVFAYADVYSETLHLECTAENAADCTVRFSLSPHGAEDWREMLTLPADQTAAAWCWNGWDIRLWEPETPHLYDLRAELLCGGAVCDIHTARIGFRTFHIEGERFVLNGRPIKLTNDSWHYMGYAIQTEEYARAYYEMAREANVNCIRLHAMPYPSFFYDIADEMGMLMVSESAIWASRCNFSYSPDFFENCKRHLRRLILRDRNHPSVIMWSPENECIPAYKVVGAPCIRDEEDLAEKVFDLTQVIPKLDPSRPYSCDGSHDLGGRLAINSWHYPGYDCPTHREKPITIGENGSMYYSTPDTVCMADGEQTLLSFDGRLTAVARDAYRNLIGQRRWAQQVCVFNLIWYGLEPLPFKEQLFTYDTYETPGIKPSRLTPYLRTLNAGAQADLPKYTPNPVWRYTKEAFTPVRPFLEHTPASAWAGEDVDFAVAVFNDCRDPLALTLTGEVLVDGRVAATAVREMPMAACTYEDVTLTLAMPTVCESAAVEVRVTLRDAAREYYTDRATLTVFDRTHLTAAWEAVRLPCLHGGEDADGPALDFRVEEGSVYGSLTRRRAVDALFTSDTLAELRPAGELRFNRPQEARCFTDHLNCNATPLYFNGVGMPLVLDLTPSGQPCILSAVDLPRYAEEEPLALWMMIRLAEYLRARTVTAPAAAYFYGDASGAVAAMLSEIRCRYTSVTYDELQTLLAAPQDALLIVDGSVDLDWLRAVGRHNFKKILVMGLTKTPPMFFYDFAVSRRNACHLCPVNTDPVIAGVYGNNLYGLVEGSAAHLAVDLLEYKGTTDSILLGVPAVDWRQWNQNAENIKTVAVHKSEQEDRSRFAALSRHTHAGSDIYFCQTAMALQNKKVKHLLVRVLSALNVAVEFSENAELAELLSGSVYGVTLNRALCKALEEGEDTATLCAGLNRVENGHAWRAVARGGHLPPRYALAVFVHSPSDRTDLLLNPDTVSLDIAAERGCELWLNGAKLGEGEQIRIPSVMLTSGWNKLMLVLPHGGEMPTGTFTRYDRSKLDLRFSLYGRDLQPIALTADDLFSANRPDTVKNAVAGREAFWISHGDQREGIDFEIRLEKPVCCKAISFSSLTSDVAGACYTPHSFELLAGDTPDTLRPVCHTLFEERMSYPNGRVFLDLGDGVTARCFTIALKTNALKPWVISDLTLLG
ncbi:MAG: hypothetical protein E7549_06870 [Ruminococcaceae bacterium]|nr:hypothetical protein [Oscillospiraceae bacterium]